MLYSGGRSLKNICSSSSSSSGRRLCISYITKFFLEKPNDSCFFSCRYLSSGGRRMSDYADAIEALNSLQTNAAVLERIRKENNRMSRKSLPTTVKYLERAGVTIADLSKLKVIHVSGTKGKGSVCAMSESILRHHGLKTGFYSSPHLVQVRERIRINGRPLSKNDFTKYFWQVFNPLHASRKDHDGTMPSYFQFLTITAFYVFLMEQVDVAVIETGIGGTYDTTNVIPRPVVCAIASLGFDHQAILGNTLESITWHKAGIMKQGVPAFTLPQPVECMGVISDRGAEIDCPVQVVPQLTEYFTSDKTTIIKLGLPGKHQHFNASLALQISRTFLRCLSPSSVSQPLEAVSLNFKEPGQLRFAKPFVLSKEFVDGLRFCSWPGRCQSVRKPNVTFYLDGAHTSHSIQACVQWFAEAAYREEKSLLGKKVARVLLVNFSGSRDPYVLLQPLVACEFDCTMFSPNVINSRASNAKDSTNRNVTRDWELKKCSEIRNTWDSLCQDYYDLAIRGLPISRGGLATISEISNSNIYNGVGRLRRRSSVTLEGPLSAAGGDVTITKKMSPVIPRVQSSPHLLSSAIHTASAATKLSPPPPVNNAIELTCILDALSWVCQNNSHNIISADSDVKENLSSLPDVLEEADHIQVLITGSLHLVGGALSMLDPDLTSPSYDSSI